MSPSNRLAEHVPTEDQLVAAPTRNLAKMSLELRSDPSDLPGMLRLVDPKTKKEQVMMA